ncbi:MAG TPA: hypothetical protein PKZ84_11170 [Anaerolineae bacterium]|nr:hypothetical protein [Anaerolineae bacterium]HQI85123.1 hypothetical protein [Anaerolineae bacterium]
MKRFWCVLIAALSLACNLVIPPTTLPPTVETAAVTPSLTPSVVVTPTATSIPASPSPSPTPTPAPTATPSGPGLELDGVHFFPWPLYAGDWVSVDIDPRLPDDVTGPLTLTWTLNPDTTLTTLVDYVGLNNALQARFYWAWQIPSTMETVPFTFTLALPPGFDDPDLTDNTLFVAVTPLPIADMREPEPEARWTSTELSGFRLHYLTHSAAERDLPAITIEAADAYADVTALFGPTDSLLDIYLLDRVIGQGGYASSAWVAVSYTDRQYTPVSLGMVLRHELTHRLDASVGCALAPSLVREGLAVYVAGGHYALKSIVQGAAVIYASEHYIPLARLADNFYAQQHEVSYMEAGAFVTYLVDNYGWDGLTTFCQAAAWNETTPDDATLLDAGLQAIGEARLSVFQTHWEAWLAAQPVTSAATAALETEVHLMETLRAYQRAYDFSAHFLEGILFDPQAGASMHITADFVRRPREAEPVALELLLVMAREALAREDTALADNLLSAVDDVLGGGFPATGLAADVRAIVAAALAQGYEPYRLTARLDGSYQVDALEYAAWPTQRVLAAAQSETTWTLTVLSLSH